MASCTEDKERQCSKTKLHLFLLTTDNSNAQGPQWNLTYNGQAKSTTIGLNKGPMGNPQGYNCDCAAFGLAFVLAELCCGDFHSKWLTRMEDSHAHNKHFPTGCHLPPFPPPTRSDCSYRLWQMQVLKFPYSEGNFQFRYFLVRTY